MIARRPYVDRPVPDRDLAASVARRAAAGWDLPEPILMRHGMNSLYRCGRVVIRVGAATAPAAAAHALAGWLLAHDVATVAPVDGLAADVDGLAATGWELVRETRRAVDWAEVGALVRRVHGLDPGAVPDGFPVAEPSSFPWWDFDAMLADVGPGIDAAALAGIERAVESHAGWRGAVRRGAVLCHGDVHPGNVLMSARGPLLIDWDLTCVAHPAWDHAMLGTYAGRWGGDDGVRESFVAGYGAPPVDADLTAALGELRNVAATLMRVRAGRDDPAAAAEAERRLRYWRGDPNAPTWQAQ